MPAAPGRNDPCPCGSGRKFKQCCLDVWSKEDSARIRIRTREGNIVSTLLDYIAKTWGDPLIHAAWEEFFLWDDVPADLMAIPEFPTMFVPWLTLGYVPDVDGDNVEEVAAAEWPQEPIGLHWLTAEMPDLDAGEREYVRIACHSPMSAFVVEAVTPGRSVDLKDILTGRRFHCLEQAGTETFRPNQLAFARIVTMEGTSVMLGTAPWVIPDDWHTRVIDFREALAGTRLMTREELFEHEMAIRNLYLEISGEILNPELPRLTNTDGDPMEWTSLTAAELEREPPEFAGMKTELLQQQVMSWLEEKIPALGGKTPLQAARTAGGRERLEALLRGYEDRVERIEAGSGRFVRELRKKLGLS